MFLILNNIFFLILRSQTRKAQLSIPDTEIGVVLLQPNFCIPQMLLNYISCLFSSAIPKCLNNLVSLGRKILFGSPPSHQVDFQFDHQFYFLRAHSLMKVQQTIHLNDLFIIFLKMQHRHTKLSLPATCELSTISRFTTVLFLREFK